jgi:hypothetical protein
MKNRELAEIRARLHGYRKERRGRYPETARQAAIAWARREWSKGATLSSLGVALGVDRKSIRAWVQLGAQKKPSGPGFRRVKVEERAQVSEVGDFTFVTSHGHRIEGLTLTSAAALIVATSIAR